MKMKFMGRYDAGTDYSLGDVVLFTDSVWYICNCNTPAAGYPCNDTLRWERCDSEVANIAELVLNCIDAVEAKTVPLPELPEDDGTYTLTATVDDGEVTYAWAAAEEAAAADAGT